MSSLEKALADWAKTPAGQTALKKAHSELVYNAKSTSRYKALGGSSLPPSFYQEQFEKILARNMAKRGLPVSYQDYIYIDDAVFDDDYNTYCFSVFIEGDTLFRPSLYPSRYDGVENILQLLNTGYHAADYVYGYWDKAGSTVRSKKDRKGLFFVQEAVAEFCAMYEPHATATIVDDEWNGKSFWEWSL